MPYPDYTRRERLEIFMDRIFQFMPMIIEIGFMCIVSIASVILAINDIIPDWVASPVVLGAWAYVNYTFWCYQAWRSSGPRGLIVNPTGPRGSDMQTTVLWLSFGVFFHLWHVWLRSSYAMHRRRERAGEE